MLDIDLLSEFVSFFEFVFYVWYINEGGGMNYYFSCGSRDTALLFNHVAFHMLACAIVLMYMVVF